MVSKIGCVLLCHGLQRLMMSVSHHWSLGFYEGPENLLFFAISSGTVLCLLLTCLVCIKDTSLNVYNVFQSSKIHHQREIEILVLSWSPSVQIGRNLV